MLVILIAVVIPQFIGALLCLGIPVHRWWTKLPAALVAAGLFFGLTTLHWRLQTASIEANGGYACGAMAAAYVFVTLYGTGFHFVVAVGLVCMLTRIQLVSSPAKIVDPQPLEDSSHRQVDTLNPYWSG